MNKKTDNFLEKIRQSINDTIYNFNLFDSQIKLAKHLLDIEKRIAFFRQGGNIESLGMQNDTRRKS